jgi:hypothetical protein
LLQSSWSICRIDRQHWLEWQNRSKSALICAFFRFFFPLQIQ